jgi:hypothetical protein
MKLKILEALLIHLIPAVSHRDAESRYEIYDYPATEARNRLTTAYRRQFGNAELLGAYTVRYSGSRRII